MRLITDLTLATPRLAFRTIDPRALFASGETGLWFSARERAGLFQDVSGTIPATLPGQSVARMVDLSGSGRDAVQATVAARPVLARHPARGLVNLANGSAAVATTTFWPASAGPVNGITGTKVGSGTLGNGLPYVEYAIAGTASALSFLELTVVSQAAIPAVVGQTWTMSASAQLIAGTPPVGGAEGVRVNVGELNAILQNLGSTSGSNFKETTTAIISATRTLSEAGLVNTRGGVTIRTESGSTVNYTIRIAGAQFEPGSTRTAYQHNLSKFDVTEAGQRDLWYLSLDGIDDFMGLASAFAPAGAWTLAAACDWHTGFPASLVLGSVGGDSFVNLASGLELRSAGVDNGLSFPATTGWPTLAAGQNRVDMIRVQDGATAQAWRNATPYPGSPVITGLATPVAGFDTLFRSGSSYGRGRLYDLLAIDRALEGSEIVRVRRHFAHTAGVILT